MANKKENAFNADRVVCLRATARHLLAPPGRVDVLPRSRSPFRCEIQPSFQPWTFREMRPVLRRYGHSKLYLRTVSVRFPHLDRPARCAVDRRILRANTNLDHFLRSPVSGTQV